MDSFDSWSGVKYIIENKRSQTGKYFGSLLWIHCVSGCISFFLCAMPSKCNLATNIARVIREIKKRFLYLVPESECLGIFARVAITIEMYVCNESKWSHNTHKIYQGCLVFLGCCCCFSVCVSVFVTLSSLPSWQKRSICCECKK